MPVNKGSNDEVSKPDETGGGSNESLPSINEQVNISNNSDEARFPNSNYAAGHGYRGGGHTLSSPESNDLSPADSAKVSEWLKDAGEDQCNWALRYFFNRANLRFHEVFPGNYSRDELVGLIGILLCDLRSPIKVGSVYIQRDAPVARGLNEITKQGSIYFLKARNAWNQKLNRARKAERSENSITVDSDTKKKIRALASDHNLKEDELLYFVFDLLYERRGSVEGIIRQRKAAKKAAIAADFGLSDEFSL